MIRFGANAVPRTPTESKTPPNVATDRHDRRAHKALTKGAET